MPSMRGISTSSVSTSGLYFLIKSPRYERIGGGCHHLHVAVAIDNFSHDLTHQR